MAQKMGWKARALKPGDETKILDLFELVFGGKETMEHWRWLFPANPFSRPIVYLAEAEDGRLVGHYSLIPIPFRKNGKPGLAALSIQSMIHPDFQRQGMLKTLAAEAERQLDEDRVMTGITFLNDNSLHAYTKHFGWTELPGGCPIYFAVLDPRGPIRKVLRSSLLANVISPFVGWLNYLFSPGKRTKGKGVVIREVKSFDSRVDNLWAAFSANMSNAVERDSRYLICRITNKPAEYSLFIAEDVEINPNLLGIAVGKVDRKFGLEFGYLVELIHDPARPEVAELLTSRVMQVLQDKGCSMATALTFGPASIRKALGRCGFWKLPRAVMPHGIHFCYKDRSAKKLDPECYNHENWFLSWSDHDVV